MTQPSRSQNGWTIEIICSYLPGLNCDLMSAVLMMKGFFSIGALAEGSLPCDLLPCATPAVVAG